VVQLDEINGVDVAVPTAAWHHDQTAGSERHALVATVAEQLDGHGSLKSEQQLVGVGVHFPWTTAGAGRPEDGEVAAVERHELVEREFGVGLRDVDRAMSINDRIIVRWDSPPTC
jgi:hypothetical protein